MNKKKAEKIVQIVLEVILFLIVIGLSLYAAVKLATAGMYP